MTVTSSLYQLFLTDKQIRGLRSRLDQAERFLKAQLTHLEHIDKQRTVLGAQLRQVQATIANDEVEVTGIDEHITELRDRMNSASTNKEYKALLTEVNTFKDKKTVIEDRELGQMETAEALKAQLAELDEAQAKREKMRIGAVDERKQREDEIADKLAELESKRGEQVKDVPADALGVYEELLEKRGEEAMAPLEIHDAKRHEFVCGSSMMSVPAETAIRLLSGQLTISPNDGCILYLTPDAEEELGKTVKK